MMKTKLFALGILFFVFGCHENKIPAVKNLDIRRYMGLWYEIARLPNTFEKDLTRVSTVYSLRDNGQIKVVNRGSKAGKVKEITGVARAAVPGTGELEVSFFRPFYAAYRIIKLAPDYRYSIVTGSNKKFLWILARKKTLSQEDLKEIKDFLKNHHFPAEKLIWSWK